MPVSLCASCGLNISDDVGLCPHHHVAYGGEDWAVANRIMCDFLHRQRVPPRLTEAERYDDVTAVTHTGGRDGYILLQISRASEA
jgi:hypothetical protein